MRISLLFRGERGKPEVKKAEEIKEYANIFALPGWKRQAGSKKSRGNQMEKNNIGRKAIKLV